MIKLFGNKHFGRKALGTGAASEAISTTSGLAAINAVDPIGFDRAKHLMRRASFSGSFAQMDALAAMNIGDALDVIFAPTTYVQTDPVGVTGSEKADARYDWFNLGVSDIPNWYTKFSYFIFNMLPAEVLGGDAKVIVAWFNFLHDSVNRNYKDTITALCRDHNMGRRLNISDNVVGAPNENFAREIMELFVLSPGPQIAVGDYTYYTEADIVEAARVFTGFRNTAFNVQMNAVPSLHDKGDKQFSAAFNNTVITGRDDASLELPYIIDMLFDSNRASDYLALRLHRYYIGDVTNQTVLDAIALSIRTNNYMFEPVLKEIFASEYFYQTDNTAQQFMCPLEVMYCCINYFNATVDLNTEINRDQTNTNLARMGELFMIPPEIKGWPGRYQEPDLNDLWANATTSQEYSSFMDELMSIDGHNAIDSIATSTDIDEAIDQVYAYTNADPIDDFIRDVIREATMSGGGTFHWTNANAAEREDLLRKMISSIAKLGETKVQ